MSEEKTPYVLAGQQPHEIVERRLLAPSQVALLLDNGSLALMDSNTVAQITLDAAATYELLDLLSKHRDELYQLVQHGEQKKPADISFLELEDEGGVYRIVGRNEWGEDIKRYLKPEEIIVPDRCPYCRMNPCICADPPEVLP